MPTDFLGRAVHRAQIDALVRLVPGTMVLLAVAATFMFYTFYGLVDWRMLYGWYAIVMLISVGRGIRAWRLRKDADYALRKPGSFAQITLTIAVFSLIWFVPPLFWFDAAGEQGRLAMAVLGAVVIYAGPLTFVTIPPAALAYLTMTTTAALVFCLRLQNPALTALTLVYSSGLVWSVLSNARQFIAHARARIELQESGEIVELLREFGAAGSGGLWELDAHLRITHISPELARAVDFDPVRVIGKSAHWLLDPEERIIHLSSGMRNLYDHFDRGEAFRDVAIPTPHSGRWWSLSGLPLRDMDGRIIGWRGVGSDITEMRLSGDDSTRAARSDPLTGIANRLLVREQLEEALLSAFGGKSQCALLAVDLDRFKLVNDTLGHAIGDRLLCEVADRLERVAGDHGSVGRLGGDEFAIVWRGPTSRQELSDLAQQIIAELSRSVQIGAASLHVGATIGIAIGNEDGGNEEALMRAADLALYRGKENGRGGYAFYDASMLRAAEDHRLLENEVRKALGGDGLRLAYQPIVDARNGRLVGREALLRWHHPVRGDIAPDVFIPIIEDSGLIHQIGDWVIREACVEAAGWSDDIRVAVNISAAQLTGAGLAKTVVSALASTGLDPSRLELEVTESVFLGDDPETLASLERLRSLGVRLVLDDFGTGYSSFGYLARSHFSKIKIDQIFVRGAAVGDQKCLAIINAILALAHGLKVETTAEGVESAAEAVQMREMGVDQLQGYHFGRPAFADEPRAAPDADEGRQNLQS